MTRNFSVPVLQELEPFQKVLSLCVVTTQVSHMTYWFIYDKNAATFRSLLHVYKNWVASCKLGVTYEGWNFNNGNYLFTTDTK